MHRFKVHTGPTLVDHFTKEWSQLDGFEDVFAGTENVWFKSSLTVDQLRSVLPTSARPVQMGS